MPEFTGDRASNCVAFPGMGAQCALTFQSSREELKQELCGVEEIYQFKDVQQQKKKLLDIF